MDMEVKRNDRAALEAAKEAGLTRYNGRTCDRHPDEGGLRMVQNGRCVACAREYRQNLRHRKAAVLATHTGWKKS